MKNFKGQSTAEYAMIIALVVAVAIGMQVYVKRGMQGRMKDAAKDYTSAISTDGSWTGVMDKGTSNANIGNGQYEPGFVSSQSTQDVTADTETSTMAKGGAVTKDTTRTTNQASGDYQEQSYP